ncbi:MAG: type II secretion system ATPase GspE [Myxococcota bacterium]
MPSRPAASMVGRPLGEILVEQFGVSVSKLGEALDQQVQKKLRVGEMLVTLKACTAEQVMQALSLQLDVPVQETIDATSIPDSILLPVPINFAKQARLIPLKQGDDGHVVAAMADPLDYAALEDLRLLLGKDVDVVISGPDAILAAINRAYDRATHHAEAAVAELEETDNLDAVAHELDGEPQDLIDMAGDEAPIIRLVNGLLSQAIKERASDIHIEPFEREMCVRFRIDGDLYEIIKPPKRFQSSILSRVKIMAGLNIAEKRLPQDGRIRIKIAGKDIDIRVSTVPTSHGERIVMRLLDRSAVLKDLTDLGFSQRDFKVMNQLIRRPHGIILVTGPTGSGKTTTLYACLSKINSPDLNILTIEDPVEYQLQGIGQVHVNPKIELTFANGLRSFLRQDPDVIMVGEIRDRETAEIAIQASLTGHLVMSTVHTNDAAGAVTRLVDMQVEPFLVASSMIGILAQRLVRVVCQECREAYQPTPEELAEIGIDARKLPTIPTIFRKRGCNRCSNTGYVGRRGIYELMLIDDDIRQLILKNVDSGTIKRKAMEKGMTTLREDGARKVLEGLTTIQEVAVVTQEDAV